MLKHSLYRFGNNKRKTIVRIFKNKKGQLIYKFISEAIKWYSKGKIIIPNPDKNP
jgi:hypothetical protein